MIKLSDIISLLTQLLYNKNTNLEFSKESVDQFLPHSDNINIGGFTHCTMNDLNDSFSSIVKDLNKRSSPRQYW